MNVFQNISLRETYFNAARLSGVSKATVDRYGALDRERDIEGLKQFDWTGNPGETHQILRFSSTVRI